MYHNVHIYLQHVSRMAECAPTIHFLKNASGDSQDIRVNLLTNVQNFM